MCSSKFESNIKLNIHIIHIPSGDNGEDQEKIGRHFYERLQAYTASPTHEFIYHYHRNINPKLNIPNSVFLFLNMPNLQHDVWTCLNDLKVNGNGKFIPVHIIFLYQEEIAQIQQFYKLLEQREYYGVTMHHMTNIYDDVAYTNLLTSLQFMREKPTHFHPEMAGNYVYTVRGIN